MDALSARLALLLKQQGQARRSSEFTPEEVSFGIQKRSIRCQHRRKIKVCGRRSGKTTSDAIELLLGGLEPPIVPQLYVGLTRGTAKEIIWPDLVALNNEFQLGYKVRPGDLELISPIGVAIQLRGAHTAAEIEKYRGKKFKKCVIDEAGSFPDSVIRPLITDVIGPALTDYDGMLTLTGTPPPLRRGFFFERWQKRLEEIRSSGGSPEDLGYFHWTVRDNERFPARLAGKDIEKILSDIREEFGWDENNPTYQREYLGQDVQDLAALLFEYIEERNSYTELPRGIWRYVLAIDLGHDDNSALACLGWREHDQVVYLVDEWRDNKVDITDCVEHVAEFRAKYSPIAMVVDQGGLGKMIAEEIRRRHRIPLEPADKAQKPAHIKLLNTALRRRELLAKATSCFADEAAQVRKDMLAMQRGLLQELPVGKGGYHGNMTDAVLYGWRRCQAWREEHEPVRPAGYAEPGILTRQALERQRQEERLAREYGQ